jgi:membrane associated rhomboid family serine protease
MGTFRTYGGSRVRWGSFLTPAIKWLLIANTAVFLVQTLVSLLGGRAAGFKLVTWFGLVPFFVTHDFRLWQPFSYLFLHGGLFHLIINMFVLWMFGGDIERTWGKRRFLNYYFLTGVGAGLVNVAVKTLLDFGASGAAGGAGLRPSEVPTIGASGAVYGVLMAAAVLFPDRQIWLIPFPVTLPMRVYVFVMGLIAFFGALGASGDNVSHITHLSGMLVGYLYLRRGTFLYRLRNRYLDWRRQRAKRKFEVYMRDHKDEPPSRPDHWVN